MTLAHGFTRYLLATIGLVTVIALLLAGAAALVMPSLLQVEDRMAKADYIVPLAGGWHRYLKAAELYKASYAPKVLLSNAKVRETTRFQKLREEMGVPEMPARELRTRLLAHLGVPDEAIDAFGEGHISTLEEAEALRGFLKGKPARIILVTSPAHTRRAKIIFQDVMPKSTFMMTAPPEKRIRERWWRHQKSAQRVVSETFKLAWYLIGGGFRSLTDGGRAQ